MMAEWDLNDADLQDKVTQRATVTIEAKYWGILKKNPNLFKIISRNVEISYCEESTEYIVAGAWKDIDAVVSLVTEAYKSCMLQSTVNASETPISTNETYLETNQLAGNAIITAKQGLVIQIQKGDIFTLKDTDCILICTDEKLSSQTGLASALRSAAGDSYRKECEKKSVPPDGCIVTDAGNLAFKKILHVVLSSWKACHTLLDFTRCISELKAVLASAFKQATRNNMQSLAIPAIGTGHLAYPTEIWISAVVEAIVDYNNDPKFTKQSLTKIVFVDQNVELLVGLGKALRVQCPQAPPVNVIDLSGADTITFRVTDCFSIKVVHGSITRFAGDAIAITDDQDLFGIRELPKSVSLAAGENYRSEKRYASSVDGKCVTGAGNLNCSKIIHVTLSTLPDIKEIARLVRGILNKANEMEMRTIALPLIGTGTFGVSVADACKVFSEVIWDFPVDYPNTTLREVCLMDPEDSNIDLLVVELTKLKPTTSGGVFGGVKSSSIEMIEHAEQPTKDTRDSATINSVHRSCDYCRDSTNPVIKSFESCGHFICSSCSVPAFKTCRVCLGNCQPKRGPVAVDKSSVQGQEKQCPICWEHLTNPQTLPCGDVFCDECISKWFARGKTVCFLCKAVCVRVTKNQPPGTMMFGFDSIPCIGYECCDSIVISYRFPGGIQDHNQHNPGSRFYPTGKTAYLPDNVEGRKVLGLLQKAFARGLTFTIGKAVTTGGIDAATWNGIQLKTSRWGGPDRYGYPDPTYLTRVQEELKAKGITDYQPQKSKAV